MSGLENLLERRCKRSIAILLGLKEREIDPFLPPEAQQKLRKAILDQLNDFCAIATDILESSSQDVVFNELWLDRLEQMHSDILLLKDGHGDAGL